MEGHKKKKSTKKERIEAIPRMVQNMLKENFVKNMIQGFELSNKMILDYMDSEDENGNKRTLEDVRNFVYKNIVEGSKIVEDVTMGSIKKGDSSAME